jgi:hypothetical protein
MTLPRDSYRRLVAKIRSQERLITALSIAVLFIVILLTLMFQMKPRDQLGWDQLLTEIRIASIVALIVFVIEGALRRLHLERIEYGVWESTLKSQIPEELAAEMITIIKEPIYRRNMRYLIDIERVNERSEMCRLRFQMAYEVVNGTDVPKIHVIKARSDAGADAEHPKLYLDGDPVPKKLPVVDRRSDREEDITPAIFEKDGVVITRRFISLTKTITVPSKASRMVNVIGSEEVPINNQQNIYINLWPTVDLYLVISNQFPDMVKNPSPRLYHRRGKRLEPDQQGTYVFKGGLLPGQGFKVQWESARQTETAKTPAPAATQQEASTPETASTQISPKDSPPAKPS